MPPVILNEATEQPLILNRSSMPRLCGNISVTRDTLLVRCTAASPVGNHKVASRKYSVPDTEASVRYKRTPRTKLSPAGLTVGMLLTVTVIPSLIYRLSEGLAAIDSSSHGVNHVNTYDRACVKPPRSTLPSVYVFVVTCEPGLKYVKVVLFTTVHSTLAALKFRMSQRTSPLVVAAVATTTSNVFVPTLVMVKVPSIAVPEVKSSVTVAPFANPWLLIVTVIVVVPAWL